MGKARRRFFIALLALGLIAAACDSADSDAVPAPTVSSSTAAPQATPPPGTTAAPPGAVDRLLVVDDDGNIITMGRDGSDVTSLTDDAASTGYFQPIWSPDASAVAVSRFDGSGFSLVRYDIATGGESEVGTEANAFYLYWSPDGSQLGYLSNGGAGMGLNLVSFDDESIGGQVDLGQPFYFDWSPSGDRLATLIGEQRFDVRDAAAAADPTEIAKPGSFQNPIWTDDGLLYVRSQGGAEQIMLGEPGGVAQILAVAPAPLIMTAPRSGKRVAVQATGTVDGVEASFLAVPTLPMNRLAILEVATGEITQVTNFPAAAYFWDPAGEKLLVLGQNVQARRLKWFVWADDQLEELTEFLPSRIWADTFLPFFGQYALSTTMWSPDGTAFAFPGLIGERGGIYVQHLAGGEPEFVSEGNWVLWSPR